MTGRVLPPWLMPARVPARVPVPGAAPASGDGGPGSEGQEPLGDGQATVAGGRLLVVEDDWFISLEIETIAEAAGHQVLGIAATAEEAVSAALDHRPELVLMDIRLAGERDGVEAAIEIRERAGIPSLFVSAHQDAAVRGRAAGARPAGWLSKPFTDAQLAGAIREALAQVRRETPEGSG